MDKAVEIRQLTKYYGSIRGVEDLSFSISRGEVFGYLGPNGAGKTTTIRLMLDLVTPTRGEVSIFGTRVSRVRKSIRSRIGYLPGEIGLYENRTGESLLNLYAGLSGAGTPLRGTVCNALS